MTRILAIALVTTAFVSTTTTIAFSQNPEKRGIGIDPAFTSTPVLPEASGLNGLDPLRSLVVSTHESLKPFSMREVMDRLAAAGEAGLTGEELFRRWWDTNNTTADAVFADDAFHCDGPQAPANGSPFDCPRLEGAEATLSDQSGSVDNYIPIGIFNRIDVAAPAAGDCGEQRLVFARKQGMTDRIDRNLIIFEARIPNPDPQRELRGCVPIAEFWASLSNDTVKLPNGTTTALSPMLRGELLHDFFFNGLPVHGVSAPVAAIHFGASEAKVGQIRTNQFGFNSPTEGPFIWTLREYKTRYQDGKLRVVPETVKATPATELFSAKTGDPKEGQAQALAQDILDQLKTIAETNPALISFSPVDDALNMGESNERHRDRGDVTVALDDDFGNTLVGTALNSADIPNGLTPENVMRRIGSLTCAGCHQFSPGDDLGGGITFQDKQFPFVHISEADIDQSPNGDGPRFTISTALHNPADPDAGFLADRMTVLKNVLTKGR